MTHLDHELPADPALDALFNRTLGSGGLSANQKRRHHERLGLQAVTAAGTLHRNARSSTSIGHGTPSIVPSPARRGVLRERLELATVLAVVALVLTGVVIYQTVLSGRGDDESATIGGTELIDDYDVYLMAVRNTSEPNSHRINRETLENLSKEPEIHVDFQEVLSRDGSTLVSVEYARELRPDDASLSGDEVTIVVRNGLTGGERTRFHPPEHVNRPVLSNDGSRLIVQSRLTVGESEPLRWHILDTTGGRLISTIERERQTAYAEAFFSPDGTTLYLADTTVPSSTDQPGPLRITAYDVATGSEVDRIELTNIPTGAWNRDPDAGSLITDLLAPGITLSPDGQQFAIAHADVQTITLLDAVRLTVERTIQLSGPEGKPIPWFEREPRAPGSPGRDQIETSAVFSADGRSLYVYGSAFLSSEGPPPQHNFGLTLVDLEEGMVTAHAYKDEQVMEVMIAPDGKSIYVSLSGQTADEAQIIQRLDAQNLDVLAERSFSQFHLIVIDPGPLNSAEDAADDIVPTPPAPGEAMRPVYMGTPSS